MANKSKDLGPSFTLPTVITIGTLAFGVTTTFIQKFQLFGQNSSDLALIVIGIAIAEILRSTRSTFRNYQPISKLDAKITNELIKSTSNLFNALAIAVTAIFLFSRMANDSHFSTSNPKALIFVLSIIFFVNYFSRSFLRFLKNENGDAKDQNNGF